MKKTGSINLPVKRSAIVSEPKLKSFDPKLIKTRDFKVKNRRESLLNAAIKTINEKGPLISMDDIAQTAKIQRTILYRYFGDKNGLYQAVSKKFLIELVKQMSFDLTEFDLRELKTIVISVLQDFFYIVEANQNLFKFIFNGLNNQDNPGFIEGIIQLLASNLQLALQEVLAEIGKDTNMAEPLAYGLIGMCYFSAQWWLESNKIPKNNLVNHLAEFITKGLS